MKVKIKHFNDLSIHELYEILQLRSEIFVVEQDCVYQDIDNKDLDAMHLCIYEKEKLVAYIRLLRQGFSYDDAASIGRVICREETRGKGYAKKIMQNGIEYLTENWGYKKITISAQQYLEKFYTELGFKRVSDAYLEDNIPHIKMIYTCE